MKRSLALTTLLLSVGLVSTTAQSAEFASADCVTGLNEIGLISVNNVYGSAQDVERVIAFKAHHGIASSRCRKICGPITGACRPFSTRSSPKPPLMVAFLFVGFKLPYCY